MALGPGTRLGPYEISAQLGVGEVYRATDTNLKRQVAVKVLPTALAGDAERLARFQRERKSWRRALEADEPARAPMTAVAPHRLARPVLLP